MPPEKAPSSHIGRPPAFSRVTGEDALDLINRLSTNEVEEMADGSGLSTVLTTNKGRVVDLLTMFYLPDHWLVLTSSGNQQKVIDWIEDFTFGEEIEVEDVSAETAVLTIVGPRAPDILHTLTQADFSALPTHHSVQTMISATEVLVSKADPHPRRGFHPSGTHRFGSRPTALKSLPPARSTVCERWTRSLTTRSA